MGKHDVEMMKQLVGMPVNAIGQVTRVTEQGIDVALDATACTVRRAASCLLAPEVGDSVLVCGPNSASLYIIAVLERSGDQAMHLQLDGDAMISTRGKLSVASDELVVRARHATTLVDKLSSFGRELSASIASVKLVGNVFESFFDRISCFAGNSVRTVEGADQVRSATIDYRAEQSLNLHGSEVIATAKALVKVDGGQIHIG